ncbi:MAG: hypothetical protein GXY81_07580 [Candidatus Cloacimonetes bacterium]|nr:hypothetical protein [Candidatus Cloacimonadota bacterium]
MAATTAGDRLKKLVRLQDGINLKRIQFDHHRQQVLLHPFNVDYRVQVVDSLQGDDISLIGTMVMQLRIKIEYKNPDNMGSV